MPTGAAHSSARGTRLAGWVAVSRRRMPSWRASLVGLAVIGSLAYAPRAGAAVTHSQITAPSDPTFLTSNSDVPNNVTVSGTSDGSSASSDMVDLLCYFGATSYRTILTGIAVDAGGNFSTPVAASNFLSFSPFSPPPQRTCVLRAVPSGTTPTAPPGGSSPFAGPRIAPGRHQTGKLSSGPNSGLVDNFFIFRAQLAGQMGYTSLGQCGLDVSYVYDPANFGPSNSAINPVFFCNDSLRGQNGSTTATSTELQATRSELRIDGADAYLPANADFIYSGADSNAGYPAVSFSDSVDAMTGNLTITESEQAVTCEPQPATYPPTSASCSSFKTAPVLFRRTIFQSANGRMASLIDRWSSTDHSAHAIDLELQNEVYADNGDAAFRFPWVSGTYQTHAKGDTVPAAPGGPGSIYVKESLAAADGDVSHPQGAITFSDPPQGALFIGVDQGFPFTEFDTLVLDYQRTVPATGSLPMGFMYSDAFTTTDVTAAAHAAEATFRPDTRITSRPDRQTLSRSATFRFNGVPAVQGTAFLCKRDGGSFSPCGSPERYRNLSRGKHTFSVAAVGPAANVDPTPSTFSWKIVKFASLSKLKISPSSLFAAPSGPTLAQKKFGATLRYLLSAAAKVTFRIERAVSRNGRTLWVKLKGKVSHASAFGVNQLHFSGRWRGKKLAPGRYRVVATPIPGPKHHPFKRASFRIKRG